MPLLISLAALCSIFIFLSTRITIFLFFALASLAILTAQSCKLYRLSRTDPLTGLYNRRRLSEQRFPSRSAILTVFYFDLDNFKQFNDSQGHAAGDQILKDFATHLRSFSPAAEAYRLGGDEFLLIFSEPVPESFLLPAGIRVTCGTAQGPASQLTALIDTAEQDMYRKRHP